MPLPNFIPFFSVEHYTVESDGSEEEDVVILTADKSSGFQQRYDMAFLALKRLHKYHLRHLRRLISVSSIFQHFVFDGSIPQIVCS